LERSFGLSILQVKLAEHAIRLGRFLHRGQALTQLGGLGSLSGSEIDIEQFRGDSYVVRSLREAILEEGHSLLRRTEERITHLRDVLHHLGRSEERRVGKECRSGW